jgi:hypothetical protein
MSKRDFPITVKSRSIKLIEQVAAPVAECLNGMSNRPTGSTIRDNHFCGSLGNFLRPHLTSGARLSVVSAYFTIYACVEEAQK